MTTKDEALKQELDALEQIQSAMPFPSAINAITACREALAQKDEHEPVAEITADDMGRPFNAIRIGAHFYKEIPPVGTKLYTAPPKRKPLTDEEIMQIGRELGVKCVLGGNPSIDFDYARAIERAHGIRGKK